MVLPLYVPVPSYCAFPVRCVNEMVPLARSPIATKSTRCSFGNLSQNKSVHNSLQSVDPTAGQTTPLLQCTALSVLASRLLAVAPSPSTPPTKVAVICTPVVNVTTMLSRLYVPVASYSVPPVRCVIAMLPLVESSLVATKSTMYWVGYRFQNRSVHKLLHSTPPVGPGACACAGLGDGVGARGT
jgi:hypothetical protein